MYDPNPPVTAENIARSLHCTRFSTATEEDLQKGIENLFLSLNLNFSREYRLDEQNRIDFLIDNGVGVEAKIGSSLQTVQRQLWRYARHETIRSLVLVTTRSKHLDMPETIRGKPLYVVYLINSFL